MVRPRLPIVPHLDPAEIARRYRACRTGVEKTHWQILWLLTRTDDPPSPAEVAERIGLTPAWVRTVLKRWNAEGPSGLADRRADRNGGRSKLTPQQQAELYAALEQPPPDGGLWSGPKVAAYARDRFGVTVCKQTGWEWLKGLGFSLQVPRPKNPGAAADERRRAWKRRPAAAGRRAPPPASR